MSKLFLLLKTLRLNLRLVHLVCNYRRCGPKASIRTLGSRWLFISENFSDYDAFSNPTVCVLFLITNLFSSPYLKETQERKNDPY